MVKPCVNHLVELREICMDFTNPLEIFREAIQNSYDAGATEIWITVCKEEIYGRERVNVIIEDNGEGIPIDKIHCFFDLGESTKSDPKTGRRFSQTVGYKGHGTKIFYNSECVILETWYDGKYIKVKMDEPRANLFRGNIPGYEDPIEVRSDSPNYVEKEHGKCGTKITIQGFQPGVANPCAHLSHVTIKDYILWFTKHGSIEQALLGSVIHKNCVLFLRSFNTDNISSDLKTGEEQYVNGYERIPFGHIFPRECYEDRELTRLQEDIKTNTNKDVNKIDLLCKKIYHSVNETGKNRPDIAFQIIFYIEGDERKRMYNKMLTPKGKRIKYHDDQYPVESRYGLWACKDCIPIVNITNWIETTGIKSRFHAFVNCDKFELTANRSTIDNTPSDIIEAIKERLKDIYKNNIQSSEEYKKIEKLIEEEENQRRLEDEKKEFKKRISRLEKIKKCKYKGVVLFEPQTEAEVYGLVVTLMALEPQLFDFEILDYRTDKGIDFLVKKRGEDTKVADMKYVELKKELGNSFNHAFQFLYKVVCYKIKKGVNRIIASDEGRKLITEKTSSGTKYYLVPDEPDPLKNKIEVIELETFLKEKLNLTFTSD